MLSVGDGQQTATGGDGGMVQRGAERETTTTSMERAAMKTDAQSSLSNFTLVKVLGKGSFGKVSTLFSLVWKFDVHTLV